MVADHSLRQQLARELHARPFPVISAPARAAYLALRPERRSERDHAAERAHLAALLGRYGVPAPRPDVTQWTGDLGMFSLKWESHTEFVSFLVWHEGAGEEDADPFAAFPDDWLAAAPGVRIASTEILIEEADGDDPIDRAARDRFAAESVAVSRVLDDQLVMAGDFQLGEDGHMHFGLFARSGTGSGRIGRVVQRLCELETYRAMAMLGFARAKELGPEIAELDAQLSAAVKGITSQGATPEATLHALLDIAAELEQIISRTSFRFSATEAYERIVHQRIDVLRECRFQGRQTFREFMLRRFDPAMRTVSATGSRLTGMSERSLRAGELLRTKVEVDRAAQNQSLLKSMDRRSDAALRLQHAVEGLSVVAISYYAVGLASYLVAPVAHRLEWDKTAAMAIVAPAVVLIVWVALKQIRKRVLGGRGHG